MMQLVLISLRNAIAHDFKTTQIKQDSVEKLIKMTEQLLETLNSNETEG